MQPPVLAPTRAGSQPWISATIGTLSFLTFPVVVALILFEPSNYYPEPWHTITRNITFLLALGAVFGIIALTLGILSLQRRITPQWAAIVGIVMGSITLALTILPTINIVVTLFTHGN